jgi:exopolysaccharide biosynthesis glucuronosyltransferase PssE
MIFVTVGHQMPFDRMIRAIDEWAFENNRDDIFAQIGTTEFEPSRIRWSPTVHPEEFRKMIAEAEVVVAHAGMGTILTAFELGTPILVMPRRGAFQETRNDHQVATAKRFLEMGRLSVAMDEHELVEMLSGVSNLTAGGVISNSASPELIQSLAEFINQDD